MGWVNVSDIRRITGVTSNDFADSEIEDFLALAQKEVNSKIITPITREPIRFIDEYRTNKLDGINQTYFVKHWKGNYFGDKNYDNNIDVNDLKVVQYDPNTQLETQLVVASIDIPNCSFTLTTAPQNVQLYVDYAYTPIEPTGPDPFLAVCVSYLAASYLFVGTDGFIMKFGNVTIQPGQSGGKGKQLFDKYQMILHQLITNSNGGAISVAMTPMDDIVQHGNRYTRAYNLGSLIPLP